MSDAESLPELLKGCLNAQGVHLIEAPIDYSDSDLILNRQIKEMSAAV